jgi:hypothetical protein
MDSLPLLRRELPQSPSWLTAFVSVWAPWLLWGVLVYFRFLRGVVLTETLSLLRFAWLADWVAVCQPGFYWRLEAYSYLRSCEGAYS